MRESILVSGVSIMNNELSGLKNKGNKREKFYGGYKINKVWTTQSTKDFVRIKLNISK